MGNTFQTNVYVSDPETGQSQWFAPGDEAPEWTEGLVDPAHFEEPADTSPATEEDADAPNYEKLNKDDLIQLADDRGLDSSGTKADIIERLVENDNALR